MSKLVIIILLSIFLVTNQRFPFINFPFNRKKQRHSISHRNSSKNSTNYTSYFLNSTIPTLNDKDFDIGIHDNNLDYFILFTVKRCVYCNDIIKEAEKAQKYYSEISNNTIKFYKVDCLSSGWTALRFELNRIPMFVYITNRVYAGFAANNYTKENIISFIESKHKDFKMLSNKIGYVGIAFKIIHVVSEAIKKKFSFWNDGFSFAVLIIIFGLFFYFEFNAFRKCCKKIGDKKYHHMTKESIRQKMNMDGKKRGGRDYHYHAD